MFENSIVKVKMRLPFFLISTVVLCGLLSCSKKETQIIDKLIVYVSIAPQKYFVEKIGKDLVDISVLVPPGSSPHTFEPKPSQMTRISTADILFTIGIDFEHAWIPRIRDNAKKLKIIASDMNIEKLKSTDIHDHHENNDSDSHDPTDNNGLDPHIWLSPELVKTQAYTIYNALCDTDSTHKSQYLKNLNIFLKEIDSLQLQIRSILKNCPHNDTFMIFHPAWGYFAKEFNLTEYPIEIDGKEPSPKELAQIIDFAKNNNIKTIFVQPQFSAQSANQIAHELGATVATVNDLSDKWAENLINTTKLIGTCKQ